MQTLNPYLKPILAAITEHLSTTPITNEYQIIQHLQHQQIEPFNDFSLANSKDLFSAHFLCMHALYHLKNYYQNGSDYTLIIDAVCIERIALSTAKSSKQDTLKQLAKLDPLASYYLDAKHYFATNQDDIDQMLTSFWQKYIAQDNKQAALQTLQLPSDADKLMIKNQYLKLAQKYHPDKGGCSERFNQIRQAKELLDKLY